MKLLLLPLLLAQAGAVETTPFLQQLLLTALFSPTFWGAVAFGLSALGAWLWKDKRDKRLQLVTECVGVAFYLTNLFKLRTVTKLDDYAAKAFEFFLEAMEKLGYKPTPKEELFAKLRLEALWGQQKTQQVLLEKAAQAQVREAVMAGVGATLGPVLARLPGGEAIHTPESFVAANPKESANQAGVLAHPSAPLAAKSTGG